MRARIAIRAAGIRVVLREVVLKDKPQALIELSPKATVPVLRLNDGTIVDESLNIMYWAWREIDFSLRDSIHQSLVCMKLPGENHETLIERNDGEFKYWLDRYKYSDRFPEFSQCYYQHQALTYLTDLEQALSERTFLAGHTLGFVDIAIAPFVRQFALVEKAQFAAMPLPKLQVWLDDFLNSDLFHGAMTKYPQWQQGDVDVVF